MGNQLRDYASKQAAPGTPEYNAALRGALRSAANSLSTGDDEYDFSRSIVLPQASAGTGDTTVLQIDMDSRYSAWLSQMADEPIVQFNLANCSKKLNGRIVGGTRIKDPRCFSEVAATFESSAKPFCSAVLISSNILLTVAHCLCDTTMQYAVFGLNLRDPQNFRFSVAGQKIHESVKCKGTGASDDAFQQSIIGHDIGIIRLSKDVPVTVAQPRALLPSDPTVDFYKIGNKNLVVVGFGHSEVDPNTPEWPTDQRQKRFGVTALVSPDCTGTDSRRYGCAPDKEMLAKDAHLVGPCPGDSGGGAYMLSDQNGSNAKVPILVGLNSRSIPQHVYPCGDGAIYTALTADNVSWINRAIIELTGG